MNTKCCKKTDSDGSSLDESTSTVADTRCPPIAGGKTYHRKKQKGQEEPAVRQEEDRWEEEEGWNQQVARQE